MLDFGLFITKRLVVIKVHRRVEMKTNKKFCRSKKTLASLRPNNLPSQFFRQRFATIDIIYIRGQSVFTITNIVIASLTALFGVYVKFTRAGFNHKRSRFLLKQKNKRNCHLLAHVKAQTPDKFKKCSVVGKHNMLLEIKMLILQTLSIERNPFPANNQTQRCYKVYISPTQGLVQIEPFFRGIKPLPSPPVVEKPAFSKQSTSVQSLLSSFRFATEAQQQNNPSKGHCSWRRVSQRMSDHVSHDSEE